MDLLEEFAEQDLKYSEPSVLEGLFSSGLPSAGPARSQIQEFLQVSPETWTFVPLKGFLRIIFLVQLNDIRK